MFDFFKKKSQQRGYRSRLEAGPVTVSVALNAWFLQASVATSFRRVQDLPEVIEWQEPPRPSIIASAPANEEGKCFKAGRITVFLQKGIYAPWSWMTEESVFKDLKALSSGTHSHYVDGLIAAGVRMMAAPERIVDTGRFARITSRPDKFSSDWIQGASWKNGGFMDLRKPTRVAICFRNLTTDDVTIVMHEYASVAGGIDPLYLFPDTDGIFQAFIIGLPFELNRGNHVSGVDIQSMWKEGRGTLGIAISSAAGSKPFIASGTYFVN